MIFLENYGRINTVRYHIGQRRNTMADTQNTNKNDVSFNTLKKNGMEAGKHLLLCGRFATEAAYVGGTMAVRGVKASEKFQSFMSQASQKAKEAKGKVEDPKGTPETEPTRPEGL